MDNLFPPFFPLIILYFHHLKPEVVQVSVAWAFQGRLAEHSHSQEQNYSNNEKASSSVIKALCNDGRPTFFVLMRHHNNLRKNHELNQFENLWNPG